MKKRVRQVASLVIAATVVLSNIIPTFADPSTFTDTQGHWAQEQIHKTHDKGFMGGYPDGKFLSNEKVSYGMTFTVLDRVFSDFNQSYARALSPEEVAHFSRFFDEFYNDLLFTQREDKENYLNLPPEMISLSDGWFQALSKDIKNFDNLKEAYGLTIHKDFAENGKETFLNDLYLYNFYNDSYDEWIRLLTEHEDKLKGELDRDTYLLQVEDLTSSDPGIRFLRDIPRTLESIAHRYEVFMFRKIDYMLQTADLSAREKNEWKKLSIEFDDFYQSFSLDESEPIQSDQHYAYNHYINMLYASHRHARYSYLAFPDGWYKDFKNMDFEQSISRDALFGLINRLLLGVSEEYKQNHNLARPVSGDDNGASEYVQTNYLEPVDIEALISAKLLDGSGSESGNAKLNLDQPLTRAELSTMANRVYEYLEKQQ